MPARTPSSKMRGPVRPFTQDRAMQLAQLLPTPPSLSFRTHEAVRDDLRRACAAHPDVASFHALGETEEGRPVDGVVLGRGPRTVSLIAGNHSDEPVGPETLRLLVCEGLARRAELAPLLDAFRFVVVPHTNPDGEARNQAWIRAWPDVEAYLRHAFREPPGRDLEFGFPGLRVENRVVSEFLAENAPFDLHVSLHGMGFGEGAMLLIERHWTFRTQPLRDGFRDAVEAAGLGLHDHNRKGEKGFFFVEPGFSTTPEGEAMRTFFRARGDDDMAERFRDSSMEFVRGLGGDPLCLVTELPLFVLGAAGRGPAGVPEAYLELRALLPELRLRQERGQSAAHDLERFRITPVPIASAVQLQLTAIDLALQRWM